MRARAAVVAYRVGERDADGQTPLSLAAEYGHEAVVKLLVEQEDVEADSKDANGRTPLSWAPGYRHEAVVKLLQPSTKTYFILLKVNHDHT
jgi:ankyrin repeat protein